MHFLMHVIPVTITSAEIHFYTLKLLISYLQSAIVFCNNKNAQFKLYDHEGTVLLICPGHQNLLWP
jgi:hypothetical protein